MVSDTDVLVGHDTVRRRLAGVGVADLLTTARSAQSTRDLAHRLNDAIESGAIVKRMYPELLDVSVHPEVRAAVGRDALDELLSDAIAPGNRVELHDGLPTPGAIEAARDPSFRGEIDLATCTSLPLATVISGRRGTSVRVVHTVDVIDPLPCCLVIAASLRRLRERGGRYIDARLAIAEQLGTELQLPQGM